MSPFFWKYAQKNPRFFKKRGPLDRLKVLVENNRLFRHGSLYLVSRFHPGMQSTRKILGFKSVLVQKFCRQCGLVGMVVRAISDEKFIPTVQVFHGPYKSLVVIT